MRRTLPPLAATLLAAVLLPGTARPADEPPEPMIGSFTATEMINILRTDKDPMRRRAAAQKLETLGPIKYPKAPAALLAALKEDSEESVRQAAAQVVGRLAATAEEIKGLKDLPKDKRDASIEARDGLLGGLREALKNDKSAKVREAAAAGLVQLAAERDPIKDAVENPEEKDKTLVAGFRAAVPLLTAALKDADPAVRATAAESLGRISKYAGEAMPTLIEVLKDKKSDAARRGAAFAIGRIGGSTAKEAVPTLAEALGDKDSSDELRRSCATAIGMLEANGAGGAAALGQALKDKNVGVRRAAATALGQIGPEARTALTAVKEAAKDPDKFVRAQALHVLGNMTQDAADVIRVLTDGMQDQLLDVRLAAIEALGNLGPEAKAAEPVLKAATRDAQAAVREAATEALKKIKTQPKD